MNETGPFTIKRYESLAGFLTLALVVAGCYVILRPFISALLWAGIICYSTWPVFLSLEGLFKGRRRLAAAVMTLLVALVLVVPFVVVGMTLAENVTQVYAMIQDVVRDGVPEPPAWVEKVPLAGSWANETWAEMAKDPERPAILMKEFLDKSQGWLLRRSISLGHGIIQLSLSVLISFFFYCYGERVVAQFSAWGRRIAGDYTKHLLQVVGATVKSVVYGLLGTAGAQGFLAAVGFKVAGVPSAFLLGLATFFLALIPGGPPFVWVPVTLWLFFNGYVGWAIFMGIWGFLVISGVDNILRPYLISRGSNLPFILVLLGVVGGMIAFGFIGLFLGPSLLAVGYALLQEWGEHSKKKAAEPPPAAGDNT